MNLALRSSLALLLVLPVGCKRASSLFGENHAGKYKTRMAAGLAAANSGLLNEAQTELTAALQSAEKMGDDAKQAAALQQLGSLSLRQGKNAEAKAQLAKAAELLAKTPSDDPLLLPTVNLQFGKAAMYQAEFAAAAEALDKAAADFEKAEDAKALAFDAALTKGFLLQTTGNHAEAQVAYRKAIEVERSRHQIGEESPELAVAYCEMGRDAVDAGELDAAGQHFDRATKILRSLRMMNKEETAPTKPIESWVAANVAWLLHEKKQPVKLDAVFSDALKNFQKFGGPARETAFLHRVYGLLLLEDEKHPQAEVELKRSLELCHAFFGAGHPELAKTLNAYAALLEATNRADEAADCRTKAKAIMAALKSPAKPAETVKQQANAN